MGHVLPVIMGYILGSFGHKGGAQGLVVQNGFNGCGHGLGVIGIKKGGRISQYFLKDVNLRRNRGAEVRLGFEWRQAESFIQGGINKRGGTTIQKSELGIIGTPLKYGFNAPQFGHEAKFSTGERGTTATNKIKMIMDVFICAIGDQQVLKILICLFPAAHIEDKGPGPGLEKRLRCDFQQGYTGVDHCDFVFGEVIEFK